MTIIRPNGNPNFGVSTPSTPRTAPRSALATTTMTIAGVISVLVGITLITTASGFLLCIAGGIMLVVGLIAEIDRREKRIPRTAGGGLGGAGGEKAERKVGWLIIIALVLALIAFIA